MIVVADASPLISLAAIDRLDLLSSLYEEVRVPAAVLQEVTEVGSVRPGSIEVKQAEWIVELPLGSEALRLAGGVSCNPALVRCRPSVARMCQ